MQKVLCNHPEVTKALFLWHEQRLMGELILPN